MAHNAGEPNVKYVSDLARLLAPQPGRLEFAMRQALICALTVCVVEIYQTPEPALTTYIVFFLNKEDRMTSLITNFIFLMLITFIIGFVLLVTMAVADDPMWRVVSMAAISFFFLFMASASKLRPVGGTLALIVGSALDNLGMIQLGEEATRAFLYVWLFVAIPTGVSIVTNLLIAPSPRRLAERAIALRLEISAAMLRAPDERVRRRFSECSREGAVQIQSWVKLAGVEKSSSPEDIAALRQAADATVVLLSAIDVMDRNPEALLPGPLRESLARTLDEIAVILTAGGYPTEIAWEVPDQGQLSPLAAKILADIKGAVVQPAEPLGLDKPVQDEPKAAGGFFEQDAFTNPDHVHYALKTTAAAMFCYVLYSLLDWPGIHTAFITCYIVSLGTTAETVEKLTLRILGCLVGAAAGTAAIVFLVPSLTSIGALMAVVFLGAYASAYVAGGSPRISYAGFQIAFAFFLCVIQGGAPAFDLTIARDRVIGILLGNLVVYLVFTNLWPVSVMKRIDPALAALLRSLGAMMTAANPWTRRALASQAQSALTAIKTDIDLAGYEPGTVRAPESWLTVRRDAAREISELEGPLLLSADQDVTTSAHIANRLETLAHRFTPTEATVPPRKANQRTEWRMLPLFKMIDTGLRRLEEAPS